MALNYNEVDPISDGRATLNYVPEEIDPQTGLYIGEGNRKTAPLNYIDIPQTGIYRVEGPTPESYDNILEDIYHPEFSRKTIQQQLAANQSGPSQFVGFLNQAISGEIVGGTMEGIGYLMNLKGVNVFAKDAEQTIGKAFIEAGKAARTWAEDTTPIYTNPDAPEFDPSSWGWWMKNGVSVASTLSLMIPAAGVVKGVGAVGKVLGLAGKVGELTKAGLSTLGMATVSRHMENMMEARGSYEEVYKRSIDSGMSDEDANKRASMAAAKTYNADWAMLGMDILQYGLLHTKFFSPNKAGIMPGLGKLLGYDKGKIISAEAKKYATEFLSEGFEEGYQWMASEESKYAAEKAFDPTLTGNFSDRVGSYLQDGEMWTNTFFGAIGGGVATGVADATKMFKGGDDQINEVKSWGINFRAAYEKSKMAASMGDEHMAAEARSELATFLGVRGASKGILDATIEMYDRFAQGNISKEDLEKLGFEPESIDDLKSGNIAETKEVIKKAGLRYIENLKEIYKVGTPLNKSLNKLYKNRSKDLTDITLDNYGRSYASLITRTELQLDKLAELESLVQRESREAEDRIANFPKLTVNKQQQFLTSARVEALKKQKSIIEKSIAGKQIDEKYKKDIEAQTNILDLLINKWEEHLNKLNKSYTKEEKEADDLINIDSIAITTFHEKEAILARLTSSIASFQSALERYRNGDISSEKAKEEYDANLENDEEEDIPEDKLEENDVVSWVDTDGVGHFGIVTSPNEEEKDILSVQEIDQDYREVGTPQTKNKVDLELIERVRDIDVSEINLETTSTTDQTPDDLYREELANSGINKALSDLPNSLSTSNIDVTKPSKVAVRDYALDTYSSNPENKFEGAVATFAIDWDNKFWDEGNKSRRQFKLKATAGKLTLKDITDLLAIDPKNAENFGVELVDKLPIKVSIKVGDQTFDKGLYLHDSDFWNVRMPDNLPGDPHAYEMEQRESNRATRQKVLTELLKGNIVTTQDIEKLNGWFNVVKTKGNIHERLGVQSGSLKLWVGVPGPGNMTLIRASATEIRPFGNPTPGGLYITTNKTANSNEVLLRVDPSRLSTEHAEILWEAIMARYSKDGGGRKAEVKDDRVVGLNAQEVIDLLVLFGDRSTNPDRPSNKHKNLDKNKALFVHSAKYLYFGDKKIDIHTTVLAEREANKLEFIEWATKNKNYRVPITNKYMALDLNSPYKKAFQIGSFKNDGSKSFAATMMDTVIGTNQDGLIYMISTNVDRVKDPVTLQYIESITHSPIIDINTRSLIIDNPKVIIKSEKKPPVKEDKEKPAKPEPIKEKKQQVAIENLKQLPSGTNFYYIKPEGDKVIFAELQTASNGKKMLVLVNGFDSVVKLHNHKNLTLVKSNQSLFNELFDYMMSGAKEINYELPISKAEKEDLDKKIKSELEEELKKIQHKIDEWKEELRLHPGSSTAPGMLNIYNKQKEDILLKLGRSIIPNEDYDTGDEDLDDLKPIGGGKGKEAFPVKPGTKIISQNEIDWLYSKLGKQNVNQVPKLIQLADQKGRFFFGVFRADAITIYQAAPADVLYHETFHRVSLGYLSEADRQRVYESARRKYALESALESEIEERLADEFMYYKSTGGKPGRRSIMEFIVDLYDFIVTFFTGKTRLRGDDVDRLFDSIERGKFRYSEIQQDRLKELAGKSYGYEIGGKDVPTIQNVKEMDDIIKGLATVLIEVNHIQDLNDVGKLDFSKLIKYINHIPDPENPEDKPGILQRFRTIRRKKELKLIDLKLTQEERITIQNDIKEVQHLIDLYESILSKDYLPVFAARIDSALASYNIVKKEQDAEDVEEGGTDNYMANLTKAKYEFNTKDTVLASIKFLIATLPASDQINKSTFTIDHVDFNDAWSRLLFDLWDKDSIEDILSTLDSKADIYYYKKLAEKLRAGDDILRIQFKVAMNKHKHMFINFLFNESTDDNGKSTFTFKMSSADVFSAAKREVMFWNQALYSTILIDKEGTPKINVAEVDKVIAKAGDVAKEFAALYKSKNGVFDSTDVDTTLESMIPIFMSIGIEVDRPTLNGVLEKTVRQKNITKSAALSLLMFNDWKFIFDRLKTEATAKTKSIGRLFADENTVRTLAEAKFETHPDLMNDSVLGPGGNQYFTYSQNTYLSDMIKKFSKDKNSVISKLKKIYNENSDFLTQMLDDNTRPGIKLMTFSSFIKEDVADSGRDYLSLNRMEDYLVKLYAFERGLVSLPTLADKRSYFFIQGLKPFDFNLSFAENGDIIIPENVINLFYNYAKDEKRRIEVAKKAIDDYKSETDPIKKLEKKNKLVSNYHYLKRGEEIDTNAANATKYHLFPSFNEEGFDFEKDAKTKIEQILRDRFEEELLFADELGIISGRMGDNQEYIPDYNNKIDQALVEKNKEDFGTETKAIKNIIMRYMVRTMQSSIEFGKLFVGDPAFKSINKDKGTVDDDYIKRLTGGLSTGDVTNNESTEYGVIGSNYTVATMYTQLMSLEKLYAKNIYNDIFDAHLAEAVREFSKKEGYEDLINKKRTEQIDILKKDFNYDIKIMLKSFKEIDPTDGQAWISPDMYRSLSIRIGDWSPKKEEAFNLLQSDKDLSKEEYVKSLNVVLQPLKVVSFGLMEDGDLEVPLFDKMAMATIFRQMGKFGNDKKTRVEMMELLDRMEAKGKYAGQTPINMIKVAKVSKTGGKGGFNFYSDTELTKVNDFSNIPVFEQPFSLSRRQLVTDPHDQSRTKAGTQMIKIGMADLLMEEAVYLDPKTGKEQIKGRDLIDIMLRSTSSLSEKGLSRLKTRLGFKDGKIDKKALVDMLKKDNIKSGTADLIVDAFKMDSDNEMYLELDAFPNRKYTLSRLISLFAKEIIDLRLPGNQFIQVSNFGMRVTKSDELKWTNIDTKKGRVTEMECYVSINLFKHVIPNYDKLSFEEKREFILRNADPIMGYRIPTQGQNSVFVMKVKDVYPETIGDTITLPAPFTSLTGSDFDIDKVYVMRYNYKIIDNQLHKVEFHDNIEDVWEKELKIKYHWVYRNLDKLDKIEGDNLSAAGGSDGVINTLNNLQKIIDDEIMDQELKEGLLYSIEINAMNDSFDHDSYKRLKQAIGDSIDKNKEAFLTKYKDEKNPYRFNSRAAVENLLLDSYKSVYTSLAHVRQTTTPLGASVGELKDLAKDIHKYDDILSKSNDLFLHSPRKQSNIKFEYTGGKDGIGPFALNNVHHVLAQIAGLKMKHTSMGLLNEDKDGNIDLSQINGKDGLSILSWLSSLIDIHVDVAKDPFVTWLNLNSATYDVTSLLIRGGFGINTFKFISQPIIKDFAKLMIDSDSSSKIRRFDDKSDIATYVRKLWSDRISTKKEGELPTAAETPLTLTELTDGDFMMNNIKNQKDKINDPAYINNQLRYLDIFINMAEAGKNLNELVQASQLDTKKFGNTVTGIIEYRNKIDNVINSGKFIGALNMFSSDTENTISFLGPYYDNFLNFTLNTLSDLTIYSTPVFNKLLETIKRQTKTEFSGDKKLTDNLADELIGAIFSKFFNDEDFIGINPTKLAGKNGIIDYVTNTITDIKYAKNPAYKDLLDNSLIKILDKHPIEDLETILPFETFLSVPNKSLSDKFSTDSLIYAWRDLFDHSDPKIKALARLLMYYSFATSVFRNRLFSFHNYIPPSKMKSIDVKDPNDPSKVIPISFNEFIKVQRDLLSDIDNLPMFSHLVDEVIINNWSNSKIVPRVPRYARAAVTNFIGNEETNEITAVSVKLKNLKIGENKLKQPIYTKYLTTSIGRGAHWKTYLLKYVGYTTVIVKDKEYTNPVYKVVSKRSYEKGGVVFKEYLFDHSIIPSNNVKSIPDGEEFNTLRGAANLAKNKAFSNFTPVVDDELSANKPVEQGNIFTGKPVQEKVKEVEMGLKPSDYTNHSGGADGADTLFEVIGSSRLFKNHNQYWYKEQTPTGNTEISEEDATEGQIKATIAARQMGRIESNQQIRDVRIIRDWAQAKYAEGIYAVSKIIRKGESLPYDKIALIDQVSGGTGYAVQMGINEGKLVYVFDQNVNSWYKWDYTTKKFEVTGDPTLTKNYAGIGTRTLNENGRRAIAKLFDDTLRNIEFLNASSVITEDPTAIYDKLGNRTQSENIIISNIKTVDGKYNREANIKAAKDNGRIYSMETDNDLSFSNPWAHFDRKGTIKTDTAKEAVENYIDWLTTDKFQEIKAVRKGWILDQLKTGELKNKPIQYYTELYEPSHATALDYLINKYNWSNEQITSVEMEEYPFNPDDEKTIFSTQNKEVYDLVVQLGISDWTAVTKEQWVSLHEKYLHCK